MNLANTSFPQATTRRLGLTRRSVQIWTGVGFYESLDPECSQNQHFSICPAVLGLQHGSKTRAGNAASQQSFGVFFFCLTEQSDGLILLIDFFLSLQSSSASGVIGSEGLRRSGPWGHLGGSPVTRSSGVKTDEFRGGYLFRKHRVILVNILSPAVHSH